MAQHYLLSPKVRDFTLADVDAMTDDGVRRMFARLRWGSETDQACPSCGVIDRHYWKATRRQWQCRDIACRRTFSVLSETKFADCKLSLKEILRIVFTFAANAKQ